MQQAVDVSLGTSGRPHEVALKLQAGDDWELNVRSTFGDLSRLRDIRSAVWDERRSIEAGTTAGGRVFWACPAGTANDETATILIGHDDEAWDIAFLVPVSVVERIGRLAEARQLDG